MTFIFVLMEFWLSVPYYKEQPYGAPSELLLQGTLCVTNHLSRIGGEALGYWQTALYRFIRVAFIRWPHQWTPSFHALLATWRGLIGSGSGHHYLTGQFGVEYYVSTPSVN